MKLWFRLRQAFTKHFPAGILEIKFSIKDSKPHQKKWWYKKRRDVDKLCIRTKNDLTKLKIYTLL